MSKWVPIYFLMWTVLALFQRSYLWFFYFLFIYLFFYMQVLHTSLFSSLWLWQFAFRLKQNLLSYCSRASCCHLATIIIEDKTKLKSAETFNHFSLSLWNLACSDDRQTPPSGWPSTHQHCITDSAVWKMNFYDLWFIICISGSETPQDCFEESWREKPSVWVRNQIHTLLIDTLSLTAKHTCVRSECICIQRYICTFISCICCAVVSLICSNESIYLICC